MSVLVVGSIALDTVKTPVEEHSNLLGGSACYAALGASFFSPIRLVGIVGDDFPESEFQFWKSRKIDSEGVQRANGKTFRWSGEYSWDLNTRETRSIDLNVFKRIRAAAEELVFFAKEQRAVLAFFNRYITRPHLSDAAPRFDEACFLRHFTRFAIVQDQKIDSPK